MTVVGTIIGLDPFEYWHRMCNLPRSVRPSNVTVDSEDHTGYTASNWGSVCRIGVSQTDRSDTRGSADHLVQRPRAASAGFAGWTGRTLGCDSHGRQPRVETQQGSRPRRTAAPCRDIPGKRYVFNTRARSNRVVIFLPTARGASGDGSIAFPFLLGAREARVVGDGDDGGHGGDARGFRWSGPGVVTDSVRPCSPEGFSEGEVEAVGPYVIAKTLAPHRLIVLSP